MTALTPAADSLADKTFILGVGAEKAGTTWLHSYLGSHPCVYMSEIKELHFFDSIWTAGLKEQNKSRYIRQIKTMADQFAREHASPVAMSRLQALTDRLSMLDGGENAYVDYFSKRVGGHHTHFGEVTPSYSLLPVDGFRQIRALLPNTKVIFLMRDPVGRLHSALRAYATRKGKVDARPYFIPALSDPRHVGWSRYDITIGNLRAVFPPDSIFIGFYETLFSDETIGRLCSFLGLAFLPGNYPLRVNAVAEKGPPLTPEQLAAASAAFAETYAFCRAEFGSSVPSSWLK